MFPILDAVQREIHEYMKRWGKPPRRIYLSTAWHHTIVDECMATRYQWQNYLPDYTTHAEQSLLGIPFTVVDWIDTVALEPLVEVYT